LTCSTALLSVFDTAFSRGSENRGVTDRSSKTQNISLN
jgi:hypothetical protein